ncbi:hypothetical protein V495_01203 [Pseudogymnoascus sp. VKM F-4514 (FW-929)]|nr:hypothetical protein V495_01203 [Pseudogymnoascus sp. VKM F-4514 (FW-929)]KFY66533.1 hypothetical protein V497_00868 [Pseudogymnoascus sp. VKM F-4516 (FW-969)]
MHHRSLQDIHSLRNDPFIQLKLNNNANKMHCTTALLLSLSSLFAASWANEIRFYNGHGCDRSEPFRGCGSIGANVCCVANRTAWGVSISKGPLDFAVAGSRGGCTSQPCLPTGGSGIFCCYSYLNMMTGGSFYTISNKRGEEATKCTSSIEPNMFGFNNGTHGSWQITKSQGSEAFAGLSKEFDSVPKEEMIDWLQAHGAVYKEEDSEQKMQSVEANQVNEPI